MGKLILFPAHRARQSTREALGAVRGLMYATPISILLWVMIILIGLYIYRG
jgi:hypothetical protein